MQKSFYILHKAFSIRKKGLYYEKNSSSAEGTTIFLFVTIFTVILYAKQKTKRLDVVANKVQAAVYPFDLTEVKLLDGPFKSAMELDEKYLLELNPDRLLSWFRKEAGLKPKCEVYGGWESMQLAGHTLGHYLSACSMMYASTGNKKMLERVNYIIDKLDTCQTANGNGYAAAIPGGKNYSKKFPKEILLPIKLQASV